MAVNNNQKEVKPFSVEYSKTKLECRKCRMPIGYLEIRIAPKVRVSSMLNDLDFFSFFCSKRLMIFEIF